ncbi:hypothetical protein NL676_033124 [Syzygium grande]|nr:hypothetical protein NL676_033124 [Syzygium grande]
MIRNVRCPREIRSVRPRAPKWAVAKRFPIRGPYPRPVEGFGKISGGTYYLGGRLVGIRRGKCHDSAGALTLGDPSRAAWRDPAAVHSVDPGPGPATRDFYNKEFINVNLRG